MAAGNLFVSSKARQKYSMGNINDLLSLSKTNFKLTEDQVRADASKGLFKLKSQSPNISADMLGKAFSFKGPNENVGQYKVHSDTEDLSKSTGEDFVNVNYLNKEMQTLLPLFKKRLAEVQLAKSQPGTRTQTRTI